MKKGIYNYSLFLTILLIITIIVKDIYVYLAPGLEVSVSLFIYAITFLIPVFIYNRTSINKAKRSIKMSAVFTLVFYLLITLLCTIGGNADSVLITNSLREVFTPNNIQVFNIYFYYPDLLIIGFLFIYVLSHYILLSTYEALSTYYNTYLSFGIAIFVAFIIDTMFSVPFWNIIEIIKGNASSIEIIRNLTSSFMFILWSSIAMILIFPLFNDSIKGD